MTTKRITLPDGEAGPIKPVTNLTKPIWEPQPNESFKLFGRFQLFRDLGANRTQRQVAAEVGITEDQISDAAVRWRWRERAEAYDKHLDEIKVKAVEDAARTMAVRQAKLGMILQDKATAALETLDLSEASVKDVVQLADTGVKIERLARGEQTAEAPSVTIQLTSIPGWAKNSPFLRSSTPVPDQDPE
jgi:hypothetical protein